MRPVLPVPPVLPAPLRPAAFVAPNRASTSWRSAPTKLPTWRVLAGDLSAEGLLRTASPGRPGSGAARGTLREAGAGEPARARPDGSAAEHARLGTAGTAPLSPARRAHFQDQHGSQCDGDEESSHGVKSFPKRRRTLVVAFRSAKAALFAPAKGQRTLLSRSERRHLSSRQSQVAESDIGPAGGGVQESPLGKPNRRAPQCFS